MNEDSPDEMADELDKRIIEAPDSIVPKRVKQQRRGYASHLIKYTK